MTTGFDPFPELTTNRLILRKLEPSDGPEVFALRSDKRILEHLIIQPATSLSDALDFIAKIDEARRNHESLLWGICLKPYNRVIGTICLWNFKKEDHRAETGYLLHPGHQRKGLMTEALQAILAYGFTTLKLHTVAAVIGPENIASATLLERNNFTREALFRENICYQGKFIDSAVYTCFSKSYTFPEKS